MEIRLYDMLRSMNGEYDELPLLKTVDIKMYEDMQFGGFVVIGGQAYRHCSYSQKEDVLCVEPAELNLDPEDEDYSEEFKCPYCGHVDTEAWELSEDEGETYCGSCGSDIEYERTYTVEYTIKPKKCAPVTTL